MNTFARKLRKNEVAPVKKEHGDIVLVLDNIYDTFNVGGMYRVADAAGVSKIYHCGDTPVPPDPKIARSSVGLHQYIPYEYQKDTEDFILDLKKRGYQIVVLEQTETSVDFETADYCAPVALVVGNESFGVSDSVISHADTAIELPMYGINKSLNVVVATGIALYHIRRSIGR